MSSITLTYGDLFCGPGGMALGAKNIKLSSKGTRYVIRPIWAIDSDRSSCLTFKNNIVKNRSIIISGEELPKYQKSEKKLVINDTIEKIPLDCLPSVNVLGFGFPCNDFSLIGEQKGLGGKYGKLYQYGVKALNILEPDFFIAENVSGLGGKKQRNALLQIIDELENAGPCYNITLHHYHLEDYGIPQTRHRFFIIGYKDKSKEFMVPRPSGNLVSALDAIEEGIIYGEGVLNGEVKNHKIKYPNPTVSKRLLQTNPGENAWTADLDDDCKLKGVKGAKFSSIYRKLDPAKPAYTVTGSGGGGTSMYHWTMEDNKQRALTNRERARLQTFPDTFEFEGNHTEVRKQIGMAVPVKAAEIIFKAALKSFLQIEYKSILSNGNNYLSHIEEFNLNN
jgi:DNA (cytosine-5)-methyltransferase 1